MSKRQCFYIPVEQFDENGYIPSLVTEGEPGHAPLKGNGPFAAPWHWGKTYEKAQQICAEYNWRDFGLTEAEATEIVLSSMTGRPVHLIADLEWTAANSRSASAQGWDLSECTGSQFGSPQIERIDDPEPGEEHDFGDDEDAVRHVWATPSPLCIKALTIMRRDNPEEWEQYRRMCASPASTQ